MAFNYFICMCRICKDKVLIGQAYVKDGVRAVHQECWFNENVPNEKSCKLGTLDKDNCEVHECTCGYHEKEVGDPNLR